MAEPSAATEPQTEEEQDRGKQILFFIVFAIIVLIVAWLLLSYLGGGADVDTGDLGGLALTYVPNVLGLTEAEARQALDEAGFLAESMETRDQYAKPDSVISQSPDGGTEAAPGITVTIEIATWDEVVIPGSEEETRNLFVVPNVVGSSQGTAESVIDSNGFVPRASKAYDQYVPSGKVVSQSPSAGTEAAFGTEVRIVVSLGSVPPGAATVPNVLGLSESAARSKVEAAGLEFWRVTRPSPPATPGRVWEQWPEAGTQVDENSQVTVIVGE